MQEKMQSFHMCGQKIVKMSNRAHLISYCTSFILLLDCFHMHQCTTYFVTNPIIKHLPLNILFCSTCKFTELRKFNILSSFYKSKVPYYCFFKIKNLVLPSQMVSMESFRPPFLYLTTRCSPHSPEKIKMQKLVIYFNYSRISC